jgi:cysteine dioxygenase
MSIECREEDEQKQRLREQTRSFFGIEKPLKNYINHVSSLNDLVRELHTIFSSDYVEIERVNHLMMVYTSCYNDWKKFAKFDRYRYTRNLVDAGNDKFNLMILCWNEGHSSAIHDHADSHCFMKVLKGSLAEVRYMMPNDEKTAITQMEPNIADIGAFHEGEENEHHEEQLQETSRATLYENQVCYINDNLGLHRVENTSNTDVAVSLHLYCPPFQECGIYNKSTSKKTKCSVTFWSKYGKREKIPE